MRFELAEALLAVVSEKTGYPAEMLELSMDMEADLGIDSIKRVEILGAMRDTVSRTAAVQSRRTGRTAHPAADRGLYARARTR